MVRQEKNQQSKEAILHAAIAEFGKHGYDGASLNAAFTQAGISKGRVYHYYDNNDQIYLDCVEVCLNALMRKLQARPDTPTGAPMNFQEYFLLRWEFFEESPALAQIFLESVQRPPEHLKEEIKAKRVRFEQFNLAVFRSNLAGMRLRNGVSEEEAIAYFQAFQEIFHRQLLQTDGNPGALRVKSHEQELQKMLDILFYGIVKEGAVC